MTKIIPKALCLIGPKPDRTERRFPSHSHARNGGDLRQLNLSRDCGALQLPHPAYSQARAPNKVRPFEASKDESMIPVTEARKPS
jgi:hypothetical protein